MLDLRSLIQRLAPKPAPKTDPYTGLHTFDINNPPERSRVHLRIDPDGHGTLLVNASRVLHFNPTAASMALLSLTNKPDQQALAELSLQYKIDPKQLAGDYAQFCVDLAELIRPDGACPVHEMELDNLAPFSMRPNAPYRMDLALTYRCNNDCAHCYNVSTRDDPELTTAQWQQIIDRLWEVGIPHLVLTGGEPTLRSDLPELIRYAEQKGMITGLNTNGRRLSDPAFVNQLVEAGLDHVQITLESHDEGIHDQMVRCKGAWKQTVHGIRNALNTRLFVMTNTTMLQENAPHLAETLAFLAELGLPTIGLNALIYSGRGASVGSGLAESELPALLELAHSSTDAHGQRLIWYTPTQYCNFDPVQMQLGVKGCTAALYNMCVEPDGGVLPCQSYYQQVGNLIQDPWNSIWKHPLCISLRERHYVPDGCKTCVLLAECGGGCPLRYQAEEQRTVIPIHEIALPAAS